jgi:hypothetical protein
MNTFEGKIIEATGQSTRKLNKGARLARKAMTLRKMK